MHVEIFGCLEFSTCLQLTEIMGIESRVYPPEWVLFWSQLKPVADWKQVYTDLLTTERGVGGAGAYFLSATSAVLMTAASLAENP